MKELLTKSVNVLIACAMLVVILFTAGASCGAFRVGRHLVERLLQ